MEKNRRAQLLEGFERTMELPLFLLSLVMIPLLVIPFAVKLDEEIERVFLTIDWIIWAVFALDLSVRTYLAEQRLAYLARHWVDVLIVVVPFLRPLRIARSARFLRWLSPARALPFAIRAMQLGHQLTRRRGLQYVIVSGIIAVLGGAALILLFEIDEEGTIGDYGTALWWAVTTITTVGYGDTFPVSPEGRGVAVLLMLVGIAFFSWVTASIAAFLVEYGRESQRPITMEELAKKLETLTYEVQSLRQTIENDQPPDSPTPLRSSANGD